MSVETRKQVDQDGRQSFTEKILKTIYCRKSPQNIYKKIREKQTLYHFASLPLRCLLFTLLIPSVKPRDITSKLAMNHRGMPTVK